MHSYRSLTLFIVVCLAAVFLLVFVNAVGISFERLGLSQPIALLLLLGSLAGSSVNIPLYRRRVLLPADEMDTFSWFFYRPPLIRQQVIAINLGGAVIPLGLAVYVAPRAPVGPVLLATGCITLLCKLLARTHADVGITMPPLIPPIIAAVLASLLAPHQAAPVAFVAGVVGTLLGADLLNLPAVLAMPAGILSIGGAGVFDGIFLVGVIAVLLA